jgi:hypothetical protein
MRPWFYLAHAALGLARAGLLVPIPLLFVADVRVVING